MRKQVLAVLLLLVVMISGCAEVSTAPTEKREPVTETKAADESRTDSVFPSESKQAAAPTESEAPEETESPESTEAPEPAAEAPVKESQPPAATASEDTKAPVSAEETPPAPTEKPQETQPPTETPQPQPTAAPEETKPKTAYDYAFDIEAIKADCIGIGQGMGLTLDSSLTPDNAAWWNPVTASQSNQGEALKQSLVSYITFHTAENLGAYGMDEITSFNICCEARGNGEYLIYFLFA